MRVLGISCFYHDSAAALIVDGQIAAAAEEERFSRIKHDFNFPSRAIKFCMDATFTTPQDLDLVVFFEKPFVKFDRILLTALATWPLSCGAFKESSMVWLLDKLWVRSLIEEQVGIPKSRIVFCSHHMSHAASAYYPSGFDKAAILTVDGVGEWAVGARGTAWGNNIELADEMRFPHSLGLLYSAFTAFLGFQVNEGEYKVMGMAAYGQPRFTETIFEKIVNLRSDGSFSLNMEYFAYQHSAYHSFSQKFVDLFGKPRTPEESNLLDPHYADIAASIQQVAEEILVRQAAYLHARTGHDNLCMAGGVALNSAANFRIFSESGFKRFYIHPAAGDNGGALGAALWGYYNVLGGTERFKMTNCYLGQEHHEYEIADYLRSQNIKFVEFPDMQAVYEEVAARLENSQVVGWMKGRFEWGPRALGARSILADPRTANMKDIVNARIKFREPFRPFAPSVLAEHAEEYFAVPDCMNVDPTRFMLMVAPVYEDKQAYIPAVTHADGTSRLQAVHYEDSPFYYELISAFYQRTGIPLVLNTSFNLRGEPIVNTPAEAFSTFARSDMDALVMGRIMVSRRTVSEERVVPGTELAKWSHTPTKASEYKPTNKSKKPAANSPSRAGWGHGLLKAGGFILLAALVLEVLVRLFVPNTNMQMKNLYMLTERGMQMRPGWHRTIKSSEFATEVKIDKEGRRSLPKPLALPGDSQGAPGVKELSQSSDDTPAVRSGIGHTVLALGDSFTFGCWSPIDKTWLNGIQNVTGAKVINAGMPNAGTDTMLRVLKETKEPADTVMLAFYSGNDFFDNMVGEASFTVDGGYLAMTPQANAKWGQYDCLASQPKMGTVPASNKIPWYQSLIRRSHLYQLISGISYMHSGGLRPNSPQAWFLSKYTPEMNEGVSRTYDYLNQMKAAAEARGANFVVVIVPSSIEVYDQEWMGWLDATGNDGALFNRRKPRQIIADWAQKRGVYCIDLLPYLVNRERLYYRGDMHWNDYGHFQVGEVVSGILDREGVFDATVSNDIMIINPEEKEGFDNPVPLEEGLDDNVDIETGQTGEGGEVNL